MATLIYRAHLERLTGKREERIEAARVSDAIAHIRQTYGKQASKDAQRMFITVNRKILDRQTMFNTPLRDGDVVSFLPIAGGG